MAVKKVRKEHPDIKPQVRDREIYKYVSIMTGLPMETVEKCFSAYADILINIIVDKTRPRDLLIALPKLGRFKLVTQRGRKKGSTYMMIDRSGNHVPATVQEDEPSFQKVFIKLKREIKATIKEGTAIVPLPPSLAQLKEDLAKKGTELDTDIDEEDDE